VSRLPHRRQEDTAGDVNSAVGSISLSSTPPGAIVYLDGELVAGQVTPCVIKIPLGAAKCKEVVVGLRSHGYKDSYCTATVMPGKTTALKKNLTATAATEGGCAVFDADTDTIQVSGNTHTWKRGLQLRLELCFPPRFRSVGANCARSG